MAELYGVVRGKGHASSSSWSVPLSGAQPDMVQILVLVGDNKVSTIATPAGWTQLNINAGAATVWRSAVEACEVYCWFRTASIAVTDLSTITLPVVGGAMAGHTACLTIQGGTMLYSQPIRETTPFYYPKYTTPSNLPYPAGGGLRIDFVWPIKYPRRFDVVETSKVTGSVMTKIYDAEVAGVSKINILGLAIGIRPGVFGDSSDGELWRSTESQNAALAGEVMWGAFSEMIANIPASIVADGELSLDGSIIAMASEGADVSVMTASTEVAIVALGTETQDFAPDSIAPTVTVFYPTAPITVASTYQISITASDSSGVQTVRLMRGASQVATFSGPGPHQANDAATDSSQNGTRDYSVYVVDTQGNEQTYGPYTVTIAIPIGAFDAFVTSSTASVSAPGPLALTVAWPNGINASSVQIQRSDADVNQYSDFGSPITSAPWVATFNVASAAENGAFKFRAKVTAIDGSIGYSSGVPITIELPDIQALTISTGLTDMMEINRLDTSRAIVIRIFGATGAPMANADPTVKISRQDSQYETATGTIMSTNTAGVYVYWPSEADVNEEGVITIAVSAPGAAPIDPIAARVVTPYGKR